MQLLPAGAVVRAALALVLGAFVGALGTVMHRSAQPWGVVICLALVLAAALTMRAWAGLVTLGGFAIGLVISMQVLASQGPGGDVLLPDGQIIGWIWVIGAVAVAALVAVLPRGIFSDEPRAPRNAPAPASVDPDRPDVAP